MANKTKFGFGSSADVEQAILDGKINARDVLFLDENTDKPKIGWITKSGKPVILTDEKADLSEVEADVEALETEMTKKANSVDVEEKLSKVATESVATAKAYTDVKVESAVNEHLVKKYNISDTPNGTIVDYKDSEIRVMCPSNAVFTMQNVGTGGKANCYYMTFTTYAPSDDVVGYVEHLPGQVDEEVLTNLSTDKYGRKYQRTWLALAEYDEASGTWTYYGKNSNVNKYVGWDYQIDWYNSEGVIIASDYIRINLSNEDCHFVNKPYYIGSIEKEIDTKISDKIAEVEASYEVFEF